ncbi:hypothetical protein [Rhizobium oryzicola]|uniref:Uncharacterized protein n=1 Tax=Rhizobium oryzicola TaxID=1232668 RepID=A0ABT8SUV7_9HYPH|nr:hypothetical protein [Rhizobium oryzicola]MDO1582210.1 hypothetical protein [Rhizobium oryzicola]
MIDVIDVRLSFSGQLRAFSLLTTACENQQNLNHRLKRNGAAGGPAQAKDTKNGTHHTNGLRKEM